MFFIFLKSLESSINAARFTCKKCKSGIIWLWIALTVYRVLNQETLFTLINNYTSLSIGLIRSYSFKFLEVVMTLAIEISITHF